MPAWRLYRDLMKPLAEDLMEWNDLAQKATIATAFQDGAPDVVTLDDRPIGWVQTIDRKQELYLAQIYIAPEFQRRGIGASIIREIIREATEKDKDVTLSVLKNNPSRNLYERLGFLR